MKRKTILIRRQTQIIDLWTQYFSLGDKRIEAMGLNLYRWNFYSLRTDLTTGDVTIPSIQFASAAPRSKSKRVYGDGTAIKANPPHGGQRYFSATAISQRLAYLFVRLPSFAPAARAQKGKLYSDQSGIALPAICSHKMSHATMPTKRLSMNSKPVSVNDSKGHKHTCDEMIRSCLQRSVYDPGPIAEILPASVPLAAVPLKSDAEDNVFAAASAIADQHSLFFSKLGFSLAIEYGVTDVWAHGGNNIEAMLAIDLSHQQVTC